MEPGTAEGEQGMCGALGQRQEGAQGRAWPGRNQQSSCLAQGFSAPRLPELSLPAARVTHTAVGTEAHVQSQKSSSFPWGPIPALAMNILLLRHLKSQHAGEGALGETGERQVYPTGQVTQKEQTYLAAPVRRPHPYTRTAPSAGKGKEHFTPTSLRMASLGPVAQELQMRCVEIIDASGQWR